MMRQLLQSVLVASTLLSANVLAQSAAEFPPVSDNAALQYWQGFGMLPALDDKEEKLLENWAEAPLDASVTKLLDQRRPSLMFLHRGAKLQRCDWGLDYRDGVKLYLPHVVPGRTLVRLAALDARLAFQAAQYERACDDAFGMAALARQIGSDHTFVSMLVGNEMEKMTVGLVAPYLPELAAHCKESLSRFDSLPPSPRFDQYVRCEKLLARAVVNQLREAERRQPGSWRQTWNAMLGEGGSDPLRGLEDFDGVLSRFEAMTPIYDDLAKLAALPATEFDRKYPAFVQHAEAVSPLAALVLPSMKKDVISHRSSEACRTMLLAGIAVVEGGPEKLATIKDPFGDGPFQYRKLDEGFELASKLTENGKPVVLEIGKKK